MTKAEYKTRNKISAELVARGFKLVGKSSRCPFHEDNKPSLTFDDDKGVWNCHAGCGGGDIFTLIARFEGKTVEQVLKETCDPLMPSRETKPARNEPQQRPLVDVVYPYHDAHGNEIFQVVRLKPKDFRQRHRGADGKWVWNMDGIERMLFNLQEVLKAKTVWVVEGEKDAMTLRALGFCATCNVGGAGKWLDAYTDALVGKDVAVCGDNDEPGRKHVEKVFDSLAGKVSTARIITIPKAYKDATEYTQSFVEQSEAAAVMQSLFDAATPFAKGIRMPVYFMQEIEPAYRQHVRDLENSSFNIGSWLPTLGREVRSLVPGELVLILGETGIGKTAMLSNIAMCAKPLKTLFFEMELPATLMYERLLSYQTKMSGPNIEAAYKSGDTLGGEALAKHFNHLAICTQSKLSPDEIAGLIVKSELKFGERPRLVLVDYAQLVNSTGGSRYERMSNTAESLKVVAKETETIIVVSSQVGRKKNDEGFEIALYDGKDSGSLENSGGLVLGAWRDPKDSSKLLVKVLKNTKGRPGTVITCNYIGEQQRITEMAAVSEVDMPGNDREEY